MGKLISFFAAFAIFAAIVLIFFLVFTTETEWEPAVQTEPNYDTNRFIVVAKQLDTVRGRLIVLEDTNTGDEYLLWDFYDCIAIEKLSSGGSTNAF